MSLSKLLHKEVQFINIKVKACSSSSRGRNLKSTTSKRVTESDNFTVNHRIVSLSRNTIGYNIKYTSISSFNKRNVVSLAWIYCSTILISSTNRPRQIFSSFISIDNLIRKLQIAYIMRTPFIFTLFSITPIFKLERNILLVSTCIAEIPRHLYFIIENIVFFGTYHLKEISCIYSTFTCNTIISGTKT